jgi:hypothetical protein
MGSTHVIDHLPANRAGDNEHMVTTLIQLDL